MILRNTDREKLQDCLMMVQSAQALLSAVDVAEIPSIQDIQKCFHEAGTAIAQALRS
jgi:hypothetical protein